MPNVNQNQIGAELNPAVMTDRDYTSAVAQDGTVQRRIASGQITIVDLNDGKIVQTYTTMSLGDAQIYKPDTHMYTPDYTAIDEDNNPVPQVASAKVFISGQSIDMAPTAACTNWVWKVNGSTTLPAWATVNSSAPHKLIINSNISPSIGKLDIAWSCTLTDPDSKTVSTVEGSKTITLVQSAGAVGLVVITQPLGNTFESGQGVTQLTAEARLMRGGEHDKTVNSVSWEILDIATAQWVPRTTGVAALNDGVSVLTVTADDVLNFQTFRCTMTDTETGESFSNIVTFLDSTDPYMVELYTLTGDVIKNGSGSTTIYARLCRGGEILEDGESVLYNYSFAKFDKDGHATPWSDTSNTILGAIIKFGNPIVVQATDIYMKATFYCNVTKKIS